MVQIPSFELVPVDLATYTEGGNVIVHPGYAVLDESGNLYIGVTLERGTAVLILINGGGYWWVRYLIRGTKLHKVALLLPKEILKDVETLVSGK